MSSKKMIILKSSDGESFLMKESAARQSQTLTCLIEDNCADTEIPMPNVTGKILGLVIKYCNKHDVVVDGESSTSSSSSDDDLKKWDAEFMVSDQSTIFELIMAANYLNIKSLLDLTCQTVADMIKDKTPEEVRVMFNIENDFTPEEELEVRRENKWAFE